MAKKIIGILCIAAVWGGLVVWSQGRILWPALLALPGAVAGFVWDQRQGRSGFLGAIFASCFVVEIWVSLKTAYEPGYIRQYLILLLLDGLLVGLFIGVTVAFVLRAKLWRL